MGFHIRSSLFFTIVILVITGCYVPMYALGAGESEALTALAAAEEKIIVCHNAVAEADIVGADVTALLATLNEAGKLISLAEWSHAHGNYDSAVNYANQSQNRLNGVVVEAEALAETAAHELYWEFAVTVGGSIVGIVAVAAIVPVDNSSS